MDYSQLVKKNGIYLYKDDSFNTIEIKLNFLAGTSNRDCVILDLLCEYLEKCNKKFNSDDEINKKTQELYDLELCFSSQFYSSQRIFNLYAELVSMNAVGEDYSKEAFEFINDLLRYPNFNDEEMLNLVKRNLLSYLELGIMDNESYATCMYGQLVIPSENRKYENSVDMDYLRDLVNSITLEDLKKEYDYIISHFHSGLVFGNISQEQFNSFVDYMKLEPTVGDLDYSRSITTNEGDIEIEKDCEQSYIFVTYDMDEIDLAKYMVLHNLFNSDHGYSYRTLRDKYGLVYSFYVDVLFYLKKFYFYSEIDYSKKDKFLEVIDEILEVMQDKEKMTSFLAETKKDLANEEYNLSEEKDDMFEILNKFILKYHGDLDRNIVNDQIVDMTEEDVIGTIKSLKRKNVFMIRSMEDE